MVGSLVLLAIVVVAPSLLFWMVVRVPRIVDVVGSFVRRRRGPAPVAPPVEQLAADLRRVHRVLVDFPPGTSAVKRFAARQAYDALLVQACAAVEVGHRLDSVAEGVDREVERLRVEDALREAGLRVS